MSYTTETAALYVSLGVLGTTYQISFDAVLTDVGSLAGNMVLDFGCGAGRSTRLLQTLSPARLVGVDRNAAMIDEACKRNHDGIEFLAVIGNDTTLPLAAESFDIVFAFYVYCEFSSRETMSAVTGEVCRLLKPGGRFYVVTTNPDCLGADYIDFHYDRNPDVKDGDPVVCHVHTNPPFIIVDHWWSFAQMEKVFQSDGFTISKKSLPLASGNHWRDEKRIAPEVVYRLIKT